MPLSWNEIKTRAIAFSKEWEGEASEDAEAKSFWDAFFEVFGVHRRRIASFEVPIKRDDGSGGFIDLLWKGILLVEHKSLGRDLDRAYGQARDYFPGLKDRDLPRYVLVSDFARFRLHDLESGEQHAFALKDLHRHIRLFGFVAGYQSRAFKDEDPANIRAAERMGKLHDALREDGYEGHKLEVLLVRLLFCLFAEDTGIFEPRRRFQDYVEQRTAEDGSDLGGHLAHLFDVLNTPAEQRQKGLDAQLSGFPYVNGKLFDERLSPAAFNTRMRERLLDACGLDWSQISPAIFGALFQSIMDTKARRNLGAHYTSEKNILKLIGPLFLDGLRVQFGKAKSSRARLHEFHEKIAGLRFLDPACGCGNFLVIAYRELRLLELQVIDALYQKDQEAGQVTDPRLLIKCNVDQFYGIEIEEFPAQIAQLALWLVDHQVNLRVSERFGNPFERLPLKTSATIVNDNALRIDWNDVVSVADLDCILGNPPFLGHHYQDEDQKADQAIILRDISARGVLDFVSNWYVKAASYIRGNPEIRCAFVSTSSITQGEQVGLLWPTLIAMGVRIRFAHRTFQWSNEARGQAAVHCVIVGFGQRDADRKLIFDYADPKAEPSVIEAKNINPYLVDAPDVVVSNRSQPICDVPRMKWGNKPTDGGNLILSPDERADLLAAEPEAEKFVRRYMSGGDFVNGVERHCLWLVDATPKDLQKMPRVMESVDAVKSFRLASKASTTRDFASYPTLFRQIAQPDSDYLAIPEVSSERRSYIPIAFVSSDVICSNKIQFVPDATRYEFGVLTSAMHMAWVRAVCGRLESRLSYSNTIVYNNFPWPELPSPQPRSAPPPAPAALALDDTRASGAQAVSSSPASGRGSKSVEAIETAAQAVLDARAAFPDSTLADLYDPTTMPPALVKAHQTLDRAVDAAYGKRRFTTDAERVAFLFERYQHLTSLLPAAKPKKVRKASRRKENA